MALLKEKAPKFMSVQQQVCSDVSLTKGEVWQSELEMLKKFSPDEFENVDMEEDP